MVKESSGNTLYIIVNTNSVCIDNVCLIARVTVPQDLQFLESSNYMRATIKFSLLVRAFTKSNYRYLINENEIHSYILLVFLCIVIIVSLSIPYEQEQQSICFNGNCKLTGKGQALKAHYNLVFTIESEFNHFD